MNLTVQEVKLASLKFNSQTDITALDLGVCKKNRNRKPNRKTEETESKNWLTEKNFQKNRFG